MRLIGMNSAMMKVRKNAAISTLLLIVTVVAASYVITNAIAGSSQPLIYINEIQLASRHSVGTEGKAGFSVNVEIVDTARLPKSLDGKYLSDLKPGLNDDLYIKCYSLEERRSILVKLEKNSNAPTYDEVRLPALLNIGGISGYDIDEDGSVYVAHWEGGIMVVANNDEAVSTIQTDGFRPITLSIDKEHRVWALGSSRNGNAMQRRSQGNQLRVYNKNGSLLKVVAGGIPTLGLGLANLIYGDKGISFISNYNRAALYKFDEGMQLSEASSFPFEQFVSDKQENVTDVLIDRPASGSTSMQTNQSPLVKGVIDMGKMKVWYGNLRSSEAGVYGNGFIGATDMQGNPLTHCVVLPAQYRAIVGADSLGNLYAVDRSNGDLVIHKVKINVDSN